MKISKKQGNVAVLDIGKTHVKVILFDTDKLEELAVFQTSNKIINKNPYPHFDVDALKVFITNSLRKLSKNHRIDSIFTSTHGACAALMSKGELILPVLDYEFDGPDQLKDEYNQIRPAFEQTGTPRMDGGLNLGAQIYWLSRYFPEEFSKVDQILFWPQFWSYWLSGITASEISYASSHSDLWDIKQKGFIDLEIYGISKKVSYPPLRSASTILGPLKKKLAIQMELPDDIPIYCGAHDSSLALVSTSLNRPLPCTILSTGTWVTIFALGSDKTEISEQPGLMISCDCFGNLVPNFRFPAGKIYQNLMQKKNMSSLKQQYSSELDLGLANFESPDKAQVINNKSQQIVDLSNLNVQEIETIISEILAKQTLKGSNSIGAKGTMICSGPFSNNSIYLNVLKENWSYSVICEDDHLGLCNGIAGLILNNQNL